MGLNASSLALTMVLWAPPSEPVEAPTEAPTEVPGQGEPDQGDQTSEPSPDSVLDVEFARGVELFKAGRYAEAVAVWAAPELWAEASDNWRRVLTISIGRAALRDYERTHSWASIELAEPIVAARRTELNEQDRGMSDEATELRGLQAEFRAALRDKPKPVRSQPSPSYARTWRAEVTRRYAITGAVLIPTGVLVTGVSLAANFSGRDDGVMGMTALLGPMMFVPGIVLLCIAAGRSNADAQRQTVQLAPLVIDGGGGLGAVGRF